MLIWNDDHGVLSLGKGKFIAKGEEVPLGVLTPMAIESLKSKGKLIEKVEEPKPEIVEPVKVEEPKPETVEPAKKKPSRIKGRK